MSEESQKPKKEAAPYVSADVAMLAFVPPEKRAALERMYATKHMAIPPATVSRTDR
jgi:hypothetical protein